MFLIWLALFVLLGLGSVAYAIISKRKDRDGHAEFFGFVGGILLIISLFMGVFAIDGHDDIKDEIIKFEVLQDAIRSEKILDLRDTTVIPNLDPNILLEKKIEYNEKILDWQNDNYWWGSGIYIPDEVDELELIK